MLIWYVVRPLDIASVILLARSVLTRDFSDSIGERAFVVLLPCAKHPVDGFHRDCAFSTLGPTASYTFG